ncbi:unnamed protein product [Amoebophrya sp. A120]|nr:unnamed protein product [Amoebophrya sp. A120]|eukprot:GSA120T00021735001.1
MRGLSASPFSARHVSFLGRASSGGTTGGPSAEFGQLHLGTTMEKGVRNVNVDAGDNAGDPPIATGSDGNSGRLLELGTAGDLAALMNSSPPEEGAMPASSMARWQQHSASAIGTAPGARKERPSLRSLMPILKYRYGSTFVDYCSREREKANPSARVDEPPGRHGAQLAPVVHHQEQMSTFERKGTIVFTPTRDLRKVSVDYGSIILPGEFYHHGRRDSTIFGFARRQSSVAPPAGDAERRRPSMMLSRAGSRAFHEVAGPGAIAAPGAASSAQQHHPGLLRKDSRIEENPTSTSGSARPTLLFHRKDSSMQLLRKDSTSFFPERKSARRTFSRAGSVMFPDQILEEPEELPSGPPPPCVNSAATSTTANLQAVANNPSLKKLLRRKESTVLEEHGLGDGKQLLRTENSTYVVVQSDTNSSASKPDLRRGSCDAAAAADLVSLSNARSSILKTQQHQLDLLNSSLEQRRRRSTLSRGSVLLPGGMVVVDQATGTAAEQESGALTVSPTGAPAQVRVSVQGGGQILVQPRRHSTRTSVAEPRMSKAFLLEDIDENTCALPGGSPSSTTGRRNSRAPGAVLRRKASEINRAEGRNVGVHRGIMEQDAAESKISVRRMTLESPKQKAAAEEESVSPAELLRSILQQEATESMLAKSSGGVLVTGGVDGGSSSSGSQAAPVGKAKTEGSGSGRQGGAKGLWKAVATVARISVNFKKKKGAKKNKAGLSSTAEVAKTQSMPAARNLQQLLFADEGPTLLEDEPEPILKSSSSFAKKTRRESTVTFDLSNDTQTFTAPETILE